MRTQAAQPKSNDSRHRWASRRDNVPAPQSRHNRPPKSNALLQLPKKLPAFEFWQVLRPPSRSRAAQMAWLVEISRAPKHLCVEPPVRPEHVRVATRNGRRRGGGEAQNRPKLKPWRVFSQRTLFGILQSKLTLPPTSNSCIY